MEGPGMSLFQGAPSIHINNSAQDRLEEQEELEDQKRRNEELKHKLANAFDDLLDDDEASSVNSSGNFTLDAAKNNSVPRLHTGLPPAKPPTYIESLNHLKEAHHISDSPKQYCETPKNHMHHMRHQDEAMKIPFSPYGAGDGQNLYYQQECRGQINGLNNYDTREEYMNTDQLRVMYEMRVKECQQLAAQIEKLDVEIDSLRARLAAAVNDRDKAELSLQEAHHLLALSKHKLIELEQQVTTLTEKLMGSDQDKEQLKLELCSANGALQEAQQKFRALQVSHTYDNDALFKEHQDRYREEMDRLQNDLVRAKSKLNERDNEIKKLERSCLEKDREKEEILIEKGATINRLANELEAAQSRLMCGDPSRWKEKVSQLSIERNAFKEQVKELGSKLEVTAHELVLSRNKMTTVQREYENWRTTLNQILVEYVPDKTYMGEPGSPVKLASLKDILTSYKSQMHKLSSLQEEIIIRDKKLEQHKKLETELRLKLDEQKAAESQLNSRLAALEKKLELLGSGTDSVLLENFKHQNEQLQAEVEQVKADLRNSHLKYTELEMENEKLKERGNRASIAQEANADLLKELERYNGQLKDTLRENGELKTLYLQACSARDTAARELKDLQAKVQREHELYRSQEKEYVERIERHKQDTEKVTANLNSAKEELERANVRIMELQKEFTDKQKDFNGKLDKFLKDEKTAMRREIEPCSQCEKHLKHIRFLDDQLSKCTIKLASQESNEGLMKELKGKAEFFQQYILDRYKKMHERRSIGTNTNEPATANSSTHETASIEKLVRDCDDALTVKHALMVKEKAIRDQIAEKFTLEMKTLELNCAKRIKGIENEQLETITKLQQLLERKAQEVDTLKNFILAERDKVTQILEAKENEITDLIKEHNALQTECQKTKDTVAEWKLRADKYKERVLKLGSVESALKNEREDWKQKNNYCARECQSVKAKVIELQSKLTQLEQKYEALKTEHQNIQEKYKNAKKTIFAYKDYVTKKDAHISNEMNRIQDEYRKIFLKLQNQLNYHVNCRIQDEKSNGKQAQAQQYQQPDYTEKINKITQDFTRLAQTRFDGEPNVNIK